MAGALCNYFRYLHSPPVKALTGRSTQALPFHTFTGFNAH